MGILDLLNSYNRKQTRPVSYSPFPMSGPLNYGG